jgi:TPR repeat protein
MVPGAEELAKADNASDSAAEAAWLWKATAKGNPTAPVRLAAMYVKGEGVPRSCEQAIVLLKTAAEKENAVARNQLASMYGSGVCVPRNRVEAYRWASSALAANPNSEWAQQRRDQLWQQMTPEERALAEKYR